MSLYHTPVMLKESIDGLQLRSGGVYVDATFGGGGHSREILRRLEAGRLFAFDQDAVTAAHLLPDNRFVFIHHNFRYLKNFLSYYGIEKVDGILADLGVSSHDFDEAGRGFSYRFDAPLDMRMNRESELTAAGVVNRYSEELLAKIFRDFGEIPNAGRLTSAIAAARASGEINTTGQLVAAIARCIPRAAEKKYLSQVFQALRMEVNQEMTVLAEFLTSSLEVLKTGGRMVVITYHSLEDRMVKHFFKTGNLEGKTEQDFWGNFVTPFRLINRKVMVPEESEQAENPRSRSAKLRIAEKTGE